MSAAESSSVITKPKIAKEDEEDERIKIFNRYEERVSILPKEKGWITDHLYGYQGFWYHSRARANVEGVMALQDSFKACATDIFLATSPKSGTTWLKALAFAIFNRTKYNLNSVSTEYSTHPLLNSNSHECVPFIEAEILKNNPDFFKNDFDVDSPPRLLATHIPYTSLPESIITSDCCIVYICRNPKDVFVSLWFFMNKMRDKTRPPIAIEDAFDLFCKGAAIVGPFWDHVLGYYKASLENPTKVLFLKYEDMKRETTSTVKKLAEFIGHGFTMEEEAQGVVQEIIEFCSFDKMKSLEVNKTGRYLTSTTNDAFFRAGKIGDSINYLSADMIRRLDEITEEKFRGFDLSFD